MTQTTPTQTHPDHVSIQIGEQPANIDPAWPLRKWLYAWLIDPKIAGNLHKDVDRWIGILIVANLLAVFASGASLVQVTNADPALLDRRRMTEKVTRTLE